VAQRLVSLPADYVYYNRILDEISFFPLKDRIIAYIEDRDQRREGGRNFYQRVH